MQARRLHRPKDVERLVSVKGHRDRGQAQLDLVEIERDISECFDFLRSGRKAWVRRELVLDHALAKELSS
jgi:hypothetical protein